MFMEMALQQQVDRRDRRERWLANRATVAGLAAVLLSFTGVIASVASFRTSDSAALHALVTAPFPLAVVAAALSFRFRRELSALRQRHVATPRGDVAIASRVVLEAPCSVMVARPRLSRTEHRTA